jgi:hypothetical protein
MLPQGMRGLRYFAIAMPVYVPAYQTSEPCLPRPANEPPSGPNWIHEIKHDVHQDGDHPHNRRALMRRDTFVF